MTTAFRSETHEQGAASAALALAGRGWLVFPLRACGKIPATRNGLKDASHDAVTVADWWLQSPDANIAVRTGQESGLLVLDVDPEHGGDDSLADLERQHGALPATVEAFTGGGGRHLYFRWPGGDLRNTAGRLGAGLDTRANGGYVVCPPSVHANGRQYVWSVDGHPEDIEPADAPAWLLGRLTDSHPAGQPRAASFWRDLAANGVREGARNDSCARLAGHLLARGVDPFVCLELVTAWDAHRNRPPLGADEAAKVVRSIARREAERWR